MVKLTDEQEKALEVLYNRYKSLEKVSVLQGYSGSGKSTLLSVFMQEIGMSRDEIRFAAFTGTAAKILSNRGAPAQTIHSLIYNPIIRYGRCIGFRKKDALEFHEQGIKLIIVDEFSMLDQDLLRDLQSFGIPLILVGDRAQLPPIGEANEYINTAHAELTEVHRQALDDPILWAATQVRLGKPLLNGVYGGTVFVDRKHNLKEEWLRPEVQFIAGLNATREDINYKITGRNYPTFGDRIIFLKNDRDHNITNGTQAKIVDMAQAGFRYKLTVETDDGMIIPNYLAAFKESKNPRHQRFDFAYCITAHKAQGSTIDSSGVIFEESRYFEPYQSNWLYTALTRFSTGNKVAILR